MRFSSISPAEGRTFYDVIKIGYYPEVVVHQSEEQEILSLLAESYLYKDLFVLDRIKKSALLERIVQAFALLLGNEVSYHELSQIAGADKETVE